MASIIKDIDFLGEVTFSSDTQVEKTLLGGLSGITYDAKKNVYYSISDDRSQKAPARFCPLTIELDKNSTFSSEQLFDKRSKSCQYSKALK